MPIDILGAFLWHIDLSAKSTCMVFYICNVLSFCGKHVYYFLEKSNHLKCTFTYLQYAQRSKETWQLQLLLTYLQNGISEQWQKIPSIIAVFAAEASLTLLDGSHAQFTVMRNFLMHSTPVSLQVTILSFLFAYM